MNNSRLRFAIVAGLALAGLGAFAAQPPSRLALTLRDLEETPSGSGLWQQRERRVEWDPTATAVVICDMWDRHWCKGATARVAEMAPRMNQVVSELRRRGVQIIHCPSETMAFYEGTPQRQLARSAPKVDIPEPLRWCGLDSSREAPLPIDDSDGGCDDEPRCQTGKWPPFPWSRQIATIEILAGDAITDSAEAYYVMRQRGITNVIVMGVHENMCVLGRPFSIRQMVKLGQTVALMRDMTDTMYNSRRKPNVDHFTGTDLVAWHIEKYWCPTVTSDQIVGGQPFRFSGDAKPPRQFLDYKHLFSARPAKPASDSRKVGSTLRDSSCVGEPAAPHRGWGRLATAASTSTARRRPCLKARWTHSSVPTGGWVHQSERFAASDATSTCPFPARSTARWFTIVRSSGSCPRNQTALAAGGKPRIETDGKRQPLLAFRNSR